MTASLFSAPNESYIEHIQRCEEKLKSLFPVFCHTVKRVLTDTFSEDKIREFFYQMVRFHDLGKLTKKWQDNIGKDKNKKLPSHAPIGAAYLWKVLPEGIKEPLVFAVAIHHTDRGLLGDNIERPDVQAILDGIVKNDGSIDWHKGVDELDKEYFPDEARDLTVNDLREMARGLRVWAKGCDMLEQHRRRLQVSLVHHILKLCDVSAATERKEYWKEDEHSYYGGWLMVEKIAKYVENVVCRRN
ncbi:CRISPR-associated endonuclease Cas3'' [Thermodesulfobacterium hveragerdense]|uniref:CRISPR-associated endonuclease Cas3'' n=1 Tax=Thermodesulfobacterium hveragerdense TaxID=53424 RepID=UPI000408D894|nr:CRISPR-associated endonuclease Cas3'' [Thermodesulfobacterium hveragerdense]